MSIYIKVLCVCMSKMVFLNQEEIEAVYIIGTGTCGGLKLDPQSCRDSFELEGSSLCKVRLN